MFDRLRELVRPTERRGHDREDRAAWIRSRLDALDREHWELLADERVPGRKQRLDAVTLACDDLRGELAALEAR